MSYPIPQPHRRSEGFITDKRESINEYDVCEAYEKELMMHRAQRRSSRQPQHAHSEPSLIHQSRPQYRKSIKSRHIVDSMAQQEPPSKYIEDSLKTSEKPNGMYRQSDIFDPLYEAYEVELFRRREQGAAKQYSDSSLMLYMPQSEPAPQRNDLQYQKNTKGMHRIEAMVTPPIVNDNNSKGRFDKIFSRSSKKSDNLEPLKSSQAVLKKLIKDPSKLVPGAYPPYIEATVVRDMKEIASSKIKQGLYRESYTILKHVMNCERETLGYSHPQVANTLYHIGVALNFMGDSKGALIALQEGIQILFPRRFQIDNMDLAALFFQHGVIEASKGDFQSALYHLDLAGQVETHLLGHCTEKTRKKTADVQNAQRNSQKINQIRSRTA